ncbi:glycoside hydrolase family 73 protein [Butyricimonas synergistica]|uniref:glycoside hydrolase family 73 protein n=1 Tax=Butyricimonas synergistica TaxID=544644 RepID=UPI0022DECD39|nr:glucosaminidase domain-containing protein [Butyricimonas synergistica]
MRKKPVKSTSVGSDLKRRIVKKQQGGVASYINVNEPVLQYKNDNWIELPDVFSEYNLPTKIKLQNEEPLPIAIKAVDTKEERAKADSERKPVKQNAFINGLRPIIEQTLKRRGLDTKWTDHLVAQAALESGWGKSESGKFNLSGIKGKGSEKNTKEYINGKMVNTRDSFRDYKDYNDWADNYINLLSNKRYGKAWTLSEDQFMPYIINAGYATDPNYISKYNKVLAEVKKYEDGGRIRRFQNGKPIKQTQAERAYNFTNPADGFIMAPYYSTLPIYSLLGTYIPPRSKDDMATPVEEAYWKHYLNLGRDKTLVPDTKSRINWDKENGANSEYVGVPQPVARRAQALADTLNMGKIVRNYQTYKEKYPELPEEDTMNDMYKFGKKLLDSGEAQQANENMTIKDINRNVDVQRRATGLEILGKFGLKWDKSTNTLKLYDTYDFPSIYTGKYSIPERKKPLRIREDIKFDPKQGSFLLRDNMKNYYTNEDKYYQ